ncbi:unnamed protein product [Penicillium olsonii]|nr:unnamed protein product [Penicillium olsonii]
MQTKSVPQRRVYGKRRANAPRAVLEASPAREPTSKFRQVDPVENIGTKLANVKIDDEPTLENSEPGSEDEDEQQDLTDLPSEESSQSSIAEVPDTQNEQASPICEAEDEQQDLTDLPSEGSSQSSIAEVPDTQNEQASPICEAEKPKTRPVVEVVIYNKAPKSPEVPEQTSELSATSSTTSEPTTIPSEPEATTTDAPSVSDSTADQEKSNAAERKRAARKKVPTARRSSGVVHDSKASEYVLAILNEALSPIAAQSIQKFDSWASRSANMFDVVKLAEGSYGEVYKLHMREEACRPVVSKSKFAKLKSYGDGVFKVVPLRAKSGPGSKKFTTIDEIVAEVKMLKYLDPIPGFARFREIHVVQGRFPESFQNAWDHYKKTKDDCMNPNPSNKRSYPDTQLWAIIEMDDAGCELEKFAWSSIFQIYDIFWGVAMALARAEEYAMFEHRDLHLGNVCIRSTREDGRMDPPTENDIARHSSASGFGFSTLETTIIDYSLSRADLLLSDDPNGLTEIASSDLDKKQLFDAIGQDEDEIMQRNTYRYMRATLYSDNPAETEKPPDIPGIWAEYAPRTNLVWLLFLLQSLFKNRKPEPQSQSQRKALAPCSPNMKALKPQPDDSKTQKPKDLQAGMSRLRDTLEERLNAVLGLLDLENGHEDMCCAADLVAYAMDSQWLGEEDFF